MNLNGQSVLITGGASGLGLATGRAVLALGAHLVIADLPDSSGPEAARELGRRARFVETDVTDPEQVRHAVHRAADEAPLRAVVHTAGRGKSIRLVDKDGEPGDSAAFEQVVRLNLVGTFNVASQAAAAMAGNEPSEGDRGAIVMTASVAAYEGQIGQAAYASSKAGVVGLTVVAARDLARRAIRICTIAPGIMETPMLNGLRDDVRHSLAAGIPHPRRFGQADEYAALACHILQNGYLNGETIRLDGSLRMPPR